MSTIGAAAAVGIAILLTNKRKEEETSPREESNPKTPVLVVTDIGADCDDTLALLALLGAPSLQLAGTSHCAST